MQYFRLFGICRDRPPYLAAIRKSDCQSDLHVKWDRPKVDQIGVKERIRWENPLESLKILEELAE